MMVMDIHSLVVNVNELLPMLNSPLTIIKLISITLNEHFGIYGYNYRISNKKNANILKCIAINTEVPIKIRPQRIFR